jgi:CBS-domain-containing membrane protein
MEPAIVDQQVWIVVSETAQSQRLSISSTVVEALRCAGIPDAVVLHDGAAISLRRAAHAAAQPDTAGSLAVTFVGDTNRVAQTLAQIIPQLTALAADGAADVTVIINQRASKLFPPHLAVGDVMRRDVVHVTLDTPVREIITLLLDQALRAAPVVDTEERVVGIVTDGDLLGRSALDLPIDLRQALPLQARAAQLTVLPDHPQRAADIMTPNPITLSATTALGRAAALLAKHDLKRVPVVDDQCRLIGMVSRGDLLQTIAERLRQRPAEPLELPAGAPATVDDVMLRDVPTAHRDTALAGVLDRLLETEKRRVVVVDDAHCVVGILTDGDLIRRIAHRETPDALPALLDWLGSGTRPAALEAVVRAYTAADVMTTPAVSVATGTSVAEATRLLMAHRVKRMPVVDGAGRLVGLVGRAGLLHALIGHHEAETSAAS